MTALKTPLRYPGGKSRATKKMAEFFPLFKDYKEFREPFLGGGSVALYVTQMYPHLDIWVNDLYEPLYTFWKQLQLNGNEIKNQLLQLKQRHPDPASAKVLFLESKEYLGNDPRRCDLTARAVAFYIVNKCSFSGLSESSSFSRQASDSNFSLRGIEKLPYYSQLIRKWNITNLSYEQLLTDEKDIFVYLDPPYDIKSNLYGKKGGMHKGFDHDRFYFDCDKFKCDQMVSYNSSNLIKSRFLNWRPYEYDHTYTMRSVGEYMKDQQTRKELLLLNYEV
ncbi:type II, N-methyl DNA methyltransferase (group alpha) [Synechococcus phage S-E7]|uniref:site-specific DNA-methyltransferase (adenine-specific) n=1 Tax=Synechococcus phage S-P4 TaxID=2484640 RepID=A0A3G3M656_9CAUD|nr:DNA methyltransferase [Synechococcus phage S-P4]AYR01891.1 type II, N-methyl DNA methyltransferase (group alpha) [Synechococcus phage S-P4]AYR02050.1 type II, N-methyl DNA methyltransferase (group alpha) [Synechococcus phage S-E7]